MIKYPWDRTTSVCFVTVTGLQHNMQGATNQFLLDGRMTGTYQSWGLWRMSSALQWVIHTKAWNRGLFVK